MIKLLDKIVFLLSIPALAGLLGSYSARYTDPNVFVLPSLLGLAYPYLLIANIVLLFYWTARWKKTALLHIAVLALGIPFFVSYYGTNKHTPDGEKADWTILSYNVRYFDRYGWSKNKKTKEKLLDYLNAYTGDIVCLQEFPPQSYSIDPRNLIRQLSRYPYHYVRRNMAVFSRFPIAAKGEVAFDPKYTGSSIYADIVKKGDTVRIFNIHLESYKLGNKERKFVKDITQGNGSGFSEGVKNLLSRITEANKNRAGQARRIKEEVEKSPLPVIVCGDFNDTPLSYTYKTLKKGLSDSFLEKGRGLGNTYIGEFPSFRIDYMLHSPCLQAVSYTRGNVNLSDHYPISCSFCLTNGK